MLGLIVILQALAVAVSGPATSPEYLPLHLAAAEGHFAREGLEIRLKTIHTESSVAEALARGEVHLAATTLDAMLRFGPHATAHGARLVYGLTAAPPCAVVVGARHTADIDALGGLASRRVGIARPGAPERAWFGWILARAGVSSTHVEVVSVGTRRLAATLDTGDIDAALVCEPTATTLLAERRATLLADLRTPAAVARSVGAPGVNAAVFARADRMPDAAELTRVARALLAATARVRSAEAHVLAGSLPARVVGAAAAFEARLAASRQLHLRDGLVSGEQVDLTIRVLRSHMPLPAARGIPTADDLLHLEPLHRALSQARAR